MFIKRKDVQEYVLWECGEVSGEGGASAAHAEASLLPEGPATQQYSIIIRFIHGMGRGVKRVVKAEKGRERERVEK